MTESFTLQQVTQPRQTRTHRRRWPYITSAVVVLGGVAVAAVLYLQLPETVARPAGNVGAVTACREAVKTRLKAPATAQFGGEETRGDGGPSSPAIVTGWVDAQNGFGAMVRNRYRCNAWRGDSAWRGDDVTFTDW